MHVKPVCPVANCILFIWFIHDYIHNDNLIVRSGSVPFEIWRSMKPVAATVAQVPPSWFAGEQTMICRINLRLKFMTHQFCPRHPNVWNSKLIDYCSLNGQLLFCWIGRENLNRKPWIFPWNMKLSCNFYQPFHWCAAYPYPVDDGWSLAALRRSRSMGARVQSPTQLLCNKEAPPRGAVGWNPSWWVWVQQSDGYVLKGLMWAKVEPSKFIQF